jgi:hypothetical protein
VQISDSRRMAAEGRRGFGRVRRVCLRRTPYHWQEYKGCSSPSLGGRFTSPRPSVANLDKRIGCRSYAVVRGRVRSCKLYTATPMVCTLQATKGARWMPWRQEPMKGAVGSDSLGEPPSRLRSEGTRMGKPGWGHAQSSRAESIGTGRSAGELKHLSTLRRRNQPRFP